MSINKVTIIWKYQIAWVSHDYYFYTVKYRHIIIWVYILCLPTVIKSVSNRIFTHHQTRHCHFGILLIRILTPNSRYRCIYIFVNRQWVQYLRSLRCECGHFSLTTDTNKFLILLGIIYDSRIHTNSTSLHIRNITITKISIIYMLTYRKNMLLGDDKDVINNVYGRG